MLCVGVRLKRAGLVVALLVVSLTADLGRRSLSQETISIRLAYRHVCGAFS